ncbi:sensor histidine kinase [Ramlibacter sp.]|uniref:sensor histidine kinase n=1 Tax=Ramlibacter sp. TaxID=1917967 RepID=UPI003D0B6238
MPCRTLRGLFAVLWLLAAGGAAFACGHVDPVGRVERTVVVGPDVTPAAGSERTTRELVSLPDALPAAVRRSGARASYRFDVTRCAATPAAAVWLFRVGAPYTVRDDRGRPLPLLNAGGLVQWERWLPPVRGAPVYNGRLPALFALPADARAVVVELVAMPYLPAGLVRLDVGPTQELLPLHAAMFEEVVAFANASSAIVLVLCALALLLWSQRRSDRMLLWLALACGSWGVRGVAYSSPLIPIDALWFEQFNPLNILLSAAAVTASVLSLVEALDRRRGLWLAGATAALGALLLATTLAGAGTGGLAARLLCFGGGFAMLSSLLVVVWRRRALLPRWHVAAILAAIGGLLLCAVHDMCIVAGLVPPDSQSYVFWGFAIMPVCFAAFTGQYVVQTLNRAERTNAELERQVEARERLLRDMHDGLGAQLMTALRGLERGALTAAQASQALHDSLDELRILMDSADMGHYLPGALAAWRHRWDHRLAAAGVALQWKIDESLDDVEVPGDIALQVMRIVQEAAANIVKHARARQMQVEARAVTVAGRPGVRVVVSDDGIGLPPGRARAGARGLKNMARRAQQIGATLELVPRAGGGTQVTLVLPLGASGVAAQGPAPSALQATSPRRAASIAASARDEMPSLR